MTSRSELRRVFAAMQVAGTEAESPTDDGRTKAVLAWDNTQSWEYGPRKAPANGERGGGGGEGEEGRKDEAVQDRRAAGVHHQFVEVISRLDRDTQLLFRLLDVAVPPHPAELRNRRTGDLDPITPAEAAIAGWCCSCWRADQAMVPIEVNRQSGLRYHKSMCRWCAGVCSTYKIDEVPLDMVRLHVDGRRIAVDVMEASIAKAKKAAAPKGKKNRKGKKAKVAA